MIFDFNKSVKLKDLRNTNIYGLKTVEDVKALEKFILSIRNSRFIESELFDSTRELIAVLSKPKNIQYWVLFIETSNDMTWSFYNDFKDYEEDYPWEKFIYFQDLI